LTYTNLQQTDVQTYNRLTITTDHRADLSGAFKKTLTLEEKSYEQ